MLNSSLIHLPISSCVYRTGLGAQLISTQTNKNTLNVENVDATPKLAGPSSYVTKPLHHDQEQLSISNDNSDHSKKRSKVKIVVPVVNQIEITTLLANLRKTYPILIKNGMSGKAVILILRPHLLALIIDQETQLN